MYPLTCAGGYAVPIRAGKFEIVQIKATIDDLSVDSRLRIIDDDGITSSRWGRILADGTDQDTGICDLKGIADTVGDLSLDLIEPIKVRDGISISYATNLVPGNIFIYVR
jgi:hypothetical protein